MSNIRIKNGFADRKGLNVIEKTIQITDFSSYTRIAIKNKFVELFKRWEKSFVNISSQLDFKEHVINLLAKDVFCISLTSEEATFSHLVRMFFNCIDDGDYFDILSVIELLANRMTIYEVGVDNYGRYKNLRVNVKNEFNKLFEDECVGYRFVGDVIEQIVDREEIREIEKALSTPYDGKVRIHITKALKCLSETGNKDYENSIKESVLALEGIGAIITKRKGTLSDHIETIASSYHLHPSFKSMVQKLYGYSSDECGIRHENEKEGHPISFEEAKYILILCCSTINYLIGVCKIEE